MKLLYIPYILLLLICLYLGFVFALQNPTEVPLELFGYAFAADSVSRWILAALTLGALLGFCSALPMVWRAKGATSRIQRQLDSCQRELDELRTTPFSGR